MEWPPSAPRPHIPCAQGSLESCRRGEHFAHNMCRLRLRALGFLAAITILRPCRSARPRRRILCANVRLVGGALRAAAIRDATTAPALLSLR